MTYEPYPGFHPSLTAAPLSDDPAALEQQYGGSARLAVCTAFGHLCRMIAGPYGTGGHVSEITLDVPTRVEAGQPLAPVRLRLYSREYGPHGAAVFSQGRFMPVLGGSEAWDKFCVPGPWLRAVLRLCSIACAAKMSERRREADRLRRMARVMDPGPLPPYDSVAHGLSGNVGPVRDDAEGSYVARPHTRTAVPQGTYPQTCPGALPAASSPLSVA